MKIALFSDIHGHLRVLLHCLRCWQMEHREFLDGALVAGDLGCFPDVARFDKATMRWIERIPEEAGFATYFTQPKDEVLAMIHEDPMLGSYSDVRCPVLFTPGNHEDYDFLNSIKESPSAYDAPEHTFPVDCYQKFSCIKDGHVARITGSDRKSLRVAALWGIEQGREHAPYLIKRNSATRLEASSFDMLLTHDAVFGAYPQERGSHAIAGIIRAVNPAFHIFGHVHPVNGQHQFPLPGASTDSWIFHDLVFATKRAGQLEKTMGILEWDGVAGNITMVESPWLSMMSVSNWRRVFPPLK